ncbi:MAG: N-acetylmuramoyl-L-alanine amidase [Bacteroidales bacterium]|nr:N-acetylmuramoyl-L-alanine amidase [Bacteroidales bacterium]
MRLIRYTILLITCIVLSVAAHGQRNRNEQQAQVPPPKAKTAAKTKAVPKKTSKHTTANRSAGVGSGQVRPRVFLNPGHGGRDSDDRPCPFFNEGMQERVEYYESESNLKGAMAMKDILRERGYEVFMSRVNNTTADDLNLFEIHQLALNSGADVFFSIHSNSSGSPTRRVNFPFAIYRGYDGDEAAEGSRRLAQIVSDNLTDCQATSWSRDGIIHGDWTFYRSRAGLGVFRWNKLPGILVENCFHDYQIERERLLNKDYCGMLAMLNCRSLDKFFNRPAQPFGMVAGIVRFDYPRKGRKLTAFGKDAYQPQNGVPVELCDLEGNPIQTYQIDNYNNGFYCFTRVRPGRYLVAIDGVEDYEIEVKADKTSYYNVTIVTRQETLDYEDEITVVHSQGTEADESAIAGGEIGQ